MSVKANLRSCPPASYKHDCRAHLWPPPIHGNFTFKRPLVLMIQFNGGYYYIYKPSIWWWASEASFMIQLLYMNQKEFNWEIRDQFQFDFDQL